MSLLPQKPALGRLRSLSALQPLPLDACATERHDQRAARYRANAEGDRAGGRAQRARHGCGAELVGDRDPFGSDPARRPVGVYLLD